MKIQAYVRIVGDEVAIRAIHTKANIPDAILRETKASKRGDGGAKWWSWNTPRVVLDPDSPDDGLKRLLSGYRSIFPVIRSQSGPDCEVYLELITEYDGKEEPRGLYISHATVSLLNEMGGSIDNDVVVHT